MNTQNRNNNSRSGGSESKLKISTQSGWKGKYEFYKKDPILNVIIIILSLLSVVVGYLIGDFFGLIIGVIFAGLLYYLTPFVKTKVLVTFKGRIR